MISGIIVAGMCVALILTMGRVAGTEQAVLSSIDERGPRLITVRAEPGAGLKTSFLERLSRVDGIEWAGAFGAAEDVRNSAFTGGEPVPLRLAYSLDFGYLQLTTNNEKPQESWAYASPAALQSLGMKGPSGGMQKLSDGTDIAVIGQLSTPDFLGFLEPLMIIPHAVPTHTADAPVGLVTVLVSTPELVPTVADLIASTLDVPDSSKVKVTTNKDLAALRGSISSDLGDFGGSLVLAIFAVSVLLVSSTLFGLVLLRRKDFGRRRALGATKTFIVFLLLFQSGTVSVGAAVFGSALAGLALNLLNDPQPPLTFYLSTVILATAAGLIAAVVPGLVASNRDPIRELRVP